MKMATAPSLSVTTISQSNGHGEDAPSVEILEHQTRKDRKRVTDRVAQREHRRRQKIYVEELEAQVKVLKQQSVTDQAGGPLLLENERLRAEIKELRKFYSAIETLVKNEKKTPPESEQNAAAPAYDSISQPNKTSSPQNGHISRVESDEGDPRNAFIISVSDSMAGNSIGIAQNVLDQEVLPPKEDDTQQQMDCQDTTIAVLPQPNQTVARDFNAMRDWWGALQHEAPSLDQINCTETDTPTWLNNFFAIGFQSPSDQFNDLGNPTTRNTTSEQHVFNDDFSWQPSNSDVGMNMINGNHSNIDQWDLPSQHFPVQESSSKDASSIILGDRNSTCSSPESARTKFEVQIHRSLSHVLMPPLPEDVYVHEIIERARSNALSQRMLLDAPTLADFLVDNSTNVLSSDLKKYLEPVRRSRRTAEYLGTYWVSYLLLRWQVNQSEESFARLPPWFRPTDLQMHVPHPIAIDFVAWPRLRDELVRLSQSEPEKVHEVMTTIGVYLELNLQSTCTQNLTNEEVLNSSVCDLRNWKLREGFFEKYPQWEGLCDPIISMEGVERV